jgi:N-acetylmuramoyl-L-alanine amidase
MMCLFLWQASIYPVLGQGGKNGAMLSYNIAKEETQKVNNNALENLTLGTPINTSWWVNTLRRILALATVYNQGLCAPYLGDPHSSRPESKIQTYEIIVNNDTQFIDKSPKSMLGDIDDVQKQAAENAVPIETGSQVLSRSLGRLVSKEDVELLSRVIYGEARGENFEGQVAVGAVVLNRLKDPRFPKTIRAIVYQSGAFTAVEDQQIYLDPDDEACKAAEAALSGVDPTNGAIFYFNPRIATDRWIKSRPVIKRIGNHIFSI